MNSFSNTILSWFRENGRELPWRETKNPYAIWLSEIILQQTRIAQGWEYWERFMAQYPTVEDLAAAHEDEVLKLWQGLGYYSRARNLHAAAKQIVALGHFPDTLEGIKQLKGVGDYTAAAIGSFAFDIPAAVVDGNVYRVLARYFGIDTPINSTQGKKEFAALAQSLLPSSKASDFLSLSSASDSLSSSSPVAAYNQAMMDFGAIQCTPQSPKCLLCPLAETCEAMRSNRIAELPVKQKTLKVKTRHLSYIYIRCNGMTAIHRRGEGDIWQGLWEPFNASDITEATASIASAQASPSSAKFSPSSAKLSPFKSELAASLHLSNVDGLQLLAQDVKHVLTHRILLADFYLLETEARPQLPDDYIWIKEEEIEDYGIPRLIELMLEKISCK
ncbi:A/G-specific adenine glycosylase [Prevotella hominis]|uniref:A/G-specific adenine glycosylase n=1 Tax=Segatella hominis TaxID=2518605 RepID=UPI001F36F1E5|nr:A/G-specific adenine glycosylase [Segatella hominis]MCF2591769.1 A/G-specific adenine glycosylase [Segatella hominis]